jgi:IS30 family transposase
VLFGVVGGIMPGLKLIQTTRTYMKSTQTNCTKALPESKHLTRIERQQIERWLKEKVKVTEIARRLNRHRSTIYREIQRGLTTHVNSDLSVSYIYQWDVAQRNYEKNQGGGGRHPKLHQAHPLMERLTSLITEKRLSPYAAMEVLTRQGHKINFCEKTSITMWVRMSFP